MNQVQSGYQRDREVVALVEECGALTAEQVAHLAFRLPSAGLRKAQQRLKRLHGQERLNRCRLEAGYCYYSGRRPGRIDHLVALNWIRVWRTSTLRSWEALERWEYEVDFDATRVDALCAVRNRWTGELTCTLVEFDRGASNNPWLKCARLNELYESEGYLQAWWARQVSKFPAVLAVTDSPSKLTEIKRAIERDNRHGLRFTAKLLDELVAEVRR